MPVHRLKALAVVLVIALATVIVAGAFRGSHAAADDLQSQAERALAAADLGDIRVVFHGREAELSGGTAEELGRAELVVEGIEGVRWADVGRPASSSATPGLRATTPTLDLSRTANGVRISGTVPDADAAASIKARVAEDFAVPVTGDLVIDPAVGDAGWIDQLPDVFGDIVGVKRLALRIDGGGTLDLSGSIESRAGADEVRRLVAAAAPDLDIQSHLDVRRGDLSEADAAVLNSSTVYFDFGSAVLDADSKRALDVVADVLQRNAGVAIEAGGHSEPVEPAAGGRLSTARVAAVKAYLVKVGVSGDRVSTRTFTSDSKSSTKPSAKQYRRVDFVVKGS